MKSENGTWLCFQNLQWSLQLHNYVCHKRLTRFEEFVQMLKISPIEVQNLAAVLKLITCILILKFPVAVNF